MGDVSQPLKHVYRGIVHSKQDEHLFENASLALTDSEKEYICKATNSEGEFVSKILTSNFSNEIQKALTSAFVVLGFTFKCDNSILTLSFHNKEEEVESATEIQRNCYYNYLTWYSDRMVRLFYDEYLPKVGVLDSDDNYTIDVLTESNRGLLIDMFEIFEVIFQWFFMLIKIPFPRGTYKFYRAEWLYEYTKTMKYNLKGNVKFIFIGKIYVGESNEVNSDVQTLYPYGSETQIITYSDVEREYETNLTGEIRTITCISDVRNETMCFIGDPKEVFGSLQTESFSKEFYGDRIENDTISYTKGLKYLTLKPKANTMFAFPSNVFDVKEGKVDFTTLTISQLYVDDSLPEEYREFREDEVEDQIVTQPEKNEKKRFFF